MSTMTTTTTLAPHNEVPLSHEKLTTVLTHLSTLLPSYFPAPVRLVVHGGACMLLHPGLYAINREGASPGGLPTNKRTHTRDVDYIHRSFVTEWIHRGLPDASDRLRECLRRTAAVFGLGLDWMNADADVALPMSVDPRTHQKYDPIYADSVAPNNIAMHTIFKSQNGWLDLISVTPAWAVALKLVRYTNHDPEDVVALLKNGTRISSMSAWTPASLEQWIFNTCAPMGYAGYDARKMGELRGKMKDAVARLSPSSSPRTSLSASASSSGFSHILANSSSNTGLVKSGSWAGSDFHSPAQAQRTTSGRNTWPLASSPPLQQQQQQHQEQQQHMRASPVIYRDQPQSSQAVLYRDQPRTNNTWPQIPATQLDDPNFVNDAVALGKILSASNSFSSRLNSNLQQGHPSQGHIYSTPPNYSSPQQQQMYSSPQAQAPDTDMVIPALPPPPGSRDRSPNMNVNGTPQYPTDEEYARPYPLDPQLYLYRNQPQAQNISQNQNQAAVIEGVADDEYHTHKDHDTRERDRERKKRDKALRKDEKKRRKEARALKRLGVDAAFSNSPSASNNTHGDDVGLGLSGGFAGLGIREEDSPVEEPDIEGFGERSPREMNGGRYKGTPFPALPAALPQHEQQQEHVIRATSQSPEPRIRSPFGRGSSVTVGGNLIVSDIARKSGSLGLAPQQQQQQQHQAMGWNANANAAQNSSWSLAYQQQQQQQQYYQHQHHQQQQHAIAPWNDPHSRTVGTRTISRNMGIYS